jgi:hypothetical protein
MQLFIIIYFILLYYNNMKSARRQFNSELNTVMPLRNAAITGGKKGKKGGMMGIVPPPNMVEFNGGVMYNDGRGNIKNTDEGVKTMTAGKKTKKASGIITDGLNIASKFGVPFTGPASAITGFLGLGKKGKKGGINSTEIKSVGNAVDGLGDVFSELGGKKGTKTAAGVFSDLGGVLDGVGSLFGLGKKKAGTQGTALPQGLTNAAQERAVNSKTGGAKAKRVAIHAGMKQELCNLEAGMKTLKKMISKIK